jgi:hypothetical protein
MYWILFAVLLDAAALADCTDVEFAMFMAFYRQQRRKLK